MGVAALRAALPNTPLLVAAPGAGVAGVPPQLAAAHLPSWLRLPPMERLPAESILNLALEHRCSSILRGAFPLLSDPFTFKAAATGPLAVQLYGLLQRRLLLRNLSVSLSFCLEVKRPSDLEAKPKDWPPLFQELQLTPLYASVVHTSVACCAYRPRIPLTS